MSKAILLSPTSPFKRTILDEDILDNEKLTPTKKQKNTEQDPEQSPLSFDIIPGLDMRAQDDDLASYSDAAQSLTDIDDDDNIFNISEDEKNTITTAPQNTQKTTAISSMNKLDIVQSLAKNALIGQLINQHCAVEIFGKDKVHFAERPSGTQYRHVTPYAIVQELIRSAVFEGGENKKFTFFTLLDNMMPLFLQISGKYLQTSELSSPGYEQVNQKYQKAQNKNSSELHIITQGEDILLSPHTGQRIFDSETPGKTTKASQRFAKKYIKNLKHQMHKLLSNIDENDINTFNIACEQLAKLILIIFNKYTTCAFAEVGNTQNFEIRLYDNEQECANKTKSYQVISIEKLHKLFTNNNKSTMNECVRTVNCEGSNVTKIVKGLKELNQILDLLLGNKDSKEKVENFNKNYNLKLIASNFEQDVFINYNKPLDLSNNTFDDLTSVTMIGAKLIYYAFDFKALENYILQKSHHKTGGIKIFSGASTNKTAHYDFVDGDISRTQELKSTTKNSNVNYRQSNSSHDIELMSKLIFIHCYLCISSFQYLELYQKDILKYFLQIAKIDHALSENEISQIDINLKIKYDLVDEVMHNNTYNNGDHEIDTNYLSLNASNLILLGADN